MTALDGKVALITGSTSGIGEATARSFAAEGATVVVNSRSSVEAGEALAGELDGAVYVQGDIADPDQAERLVADAVAATGRLDVLVNNAGTTEIIPHHDLDAVTPEVWHKILDTNVIGTWMVTRAAMAHLRASGAGSVVNIGSVAGVRQTGSSLPYGVSKAALHHMTEMLANVVGPTVRVNAVAPGLIETPWTERFGDAAFEYYAGGHPLDRWGQPAEIAEVVLGLVTSAFVNGQTIVVDGGHTLRH